MAVFDSGDREGFSMATGEAAIAACWVERRGAFVCEVWFEILGLIWLGLVRGWERAICDCGLDCVLGWLLIAGRTVLLFTGRRVNLLDAAEGSSWLGLVVVALAILLASGAFFAAIGNDEVSLRTRALEGEALAVVLLVAAFEVSRRRGELEEDCATFVFGWMAGAGEGFSGLGWLAG